MLHLSKFKLIMKGKKMGAKEKLRKQNFIDDSFSYAKYSKHMDAIFDSVIDYGYVDRVVDGQAGNPNIGRKDTEEYCAFRVKENKKEDFEKIMQDLNIYLSKEKLNSAGQERDFYMFKSNNIPELKNIIRGSVKIKQQEAAIISHMTTYVK